MRWLRRNILIILDVLKFVGILSLILMFITFNAKVADQTKTTQTQTKITQNIVKSQGDILDAIKRAEEDNNLTSEQKANLIICMLQVPVEQRTTNTLESCKKQASSEVTKGATQSQNSQPTPTSAPSSTSPSQTPSTSPSTHPTPAPTQTKITKSIMDGITSLIKGVGCDLRLRKC